MPNELNRKIKGTILKGHRHLSVKHGQQGDQKFNGQRSNFGFIVFSKRERILKKKMIESICIKMISSNRRREGKASVLSYEVILLIGFQPTIEVAADFQRFLAFL